MDVMPWMPWMVLESHFRQDWMSVSFRQPGLPGTPTPPGELTELSQAADEMRNRVRCSAGCDIDIFAKAVFQYFGFMLFQAQTAGGATYILVCHFL